MNKYVDFFITFAFKIMIAVSGAWVGAIHILLAMGIDPHQINAILLSADYNIYYWLFFFLIIASVVFWISIEIIYRQLHDNFWLEKR
jgi:hypothetical protein